LSGGAVAGSGITGPPLLLELEELDELELLELELPVPPELLLPPLLLPGLASLPPQAARLSARSNRAVA